MENDTKDETPFERFSKGVSFDERVAGIRMKIAKINQNRDFRRAYSKGKYAAHPLSVTYAVKTAEARPELALPHPKKLEMQYSETGQGE